MSTPLRGTCRHHTLLEPSHFYGEPDVFDCVGVSLVPGTGGWAVSAVYDGSPAADAGFHVGDIVTHINGKTPSNLDPEHVRILKRGPVGSTMRFTLKGKGAQGTRRVKITLRDIA